MRLLKRAMVGAVLALSALMTLAAEDFRLVRSVSGPSGRVQGSTFAFDELRGRFVHPQDKSFIVYFEWDGPPGIHVLSALWKRPDGQIDSVSPEVKVESNSRNLTCYWTYTINPEMPPGVWAVEVRIDGQPAGSHPFEVAGTTPAQPGAPPPPKAPTLDRVFRMVSPSLVWVRKINGAGKRIDRASGFVTGKDRVVTAFQAVDGAARLEIEFAGGRRIETDEILAFSRMGDWAVVRASTGAVADVQRADWKTIAVGERLIVFETEGDTRTIGGVDISGIRNVPGFGERIQFSPGISLASAGGPLLNSEGRVVGIIGGSLMPGARFSVHQISVNPALELSTRSMTAATPVNDVPESMPEIPSGLGHLASSGALTGILEETDALLYVTTALEVSKSASDPLPKDVGEFSRRDKHVYVLSEWQRKGKVSKGLLSAKVYDVRNRVRVVVEPKKVSLDSAPTRSVFGFSPAQLDPGIYRIDLIWNDQAVWRTFIRISD